MNLTLNKNIKTIEDLIDSANKLKETQPLELDKIKSELVFPLVELLGYDTTDPSEFMNCQVFDLNGKEMFDFELTKNPAGSRSNIVLKIVDSSDLINEYKQLVQDVFGLYKPIGFAIITDGFSYCIYEASKSKAIDYSKITINPLATIDLTDLKPEDESLLRILSKEQKKINLQSSVKLQYSDEDEENDYNKPTINKDKLKKITTSGLKIVITVTLIIIFITLAFLKLLGQKGSAVEANEGNPVVNNPAPSVGPSSGTNNNPITLDTSLQYIYLTSILELNVYQPNNILQVHLISDILEGGIIKFEFYCGDKKEILYGITDKKGQSVVEYNIPEEWNHPDIKVVAYLRFDESSYPQPKSLAKLYGSQGEYIVQKSDYPIYGIVQNVTTHSNKNVEKYVKQYNLEKQSSLAKDATIDFSKTGQLIDSQNNLKIVPEGYSLTQANIGENRYIYPQIYIDEKNNKAYFYVVVGHMGRDLINMRAISFNANGHKWGYEIGSNQTGTTVSGGLAAEWVYFNQHDTPKLMNDMRLLANANESTVAIAGHRRKEHLLTEEEHSNLKYFIYLFEKYFKDGFNFPLEMISNDKLNSVSLEHIKKPARILVRTSNEDIQIKKLVEESHNGKPSEENLEKMKNSYRLLKGEMITSLHNEIINSKGTPEYKDDTDSKTYIRLIFDYLESRHIEEGFVTEIILYDDGSFHIPFKSQSFSSDKLTATFAKTEMSQNLFTRLIKSIESTSYTEIQK